MLGFGVLAGVWLAGAAIEGYGYRRSQRELGEGNRRQAMGWVSATSLGRVYMVTTAVLLVGLLGDREDGLAAAVLAAVLFTVHFLTPLHREQDGGRGGGGRSMKTWQKFLLGFGIYIGITILVFIIFGSDGENNEFQPQNEFKLEPWVQLKIFGIDMSITKAVLYLFLASAFDDRDDVLDRPQDAWRSRTARRPRSSSPTT